MTPEAVTFGKFCIVNAIIYQEFLYKYIMNVLFPFIDTGCRDGPITFRVVAKKKGSNNVRHTPSNTKDKCEKRCLDLVRLTVM